MVKTVNGMKALLFPLQGEFDSVEKHLTLQMKAYIICRSKSEKKKKIHIDKNSFFRQNKITCTYIVPTI